MTKEQKEAIEMLEDIKNNTWTTKYIMSSDSKKAETVLNMLKEKDAIEKKDKRMIDLMAEELQKHIFVLHDGDTVTSKKGIIEHYKRKATNDG